MKNFSLYGNKFYLQAIGNGNTLSKASFNIATLYPDEYTNFKEYNFYFRYTSASTGRGGDEIVIDTSSPLYDSSTGILTGPRTYGTYSASVRYLNYTVYLVKTKDMIYNLKLIYSGSSDAAKTVDIASMYPEYYNLTMANFYIKKINYSTRSGGGDYINFSIPTYDPIIGLLTIPAHNGAMNNSFRYYTYEVYLLT